MGKQYDLKKEWPKIKKELVRISREAIKLAKKGEKELIKISYRGKLQIDSTALNLKREHIFHLIGKEYVKSDCPEIQTPKLKKLVLEVKKIDKHIAVLKRKIKGKNGGTKAKKGLKTQKVSK